MNDGEKIINLLDFFKRQMISIQITQEVDKKPTVHAIISYERELPVGWREGLKETEGDNVLEALERMKEKFA